MALGLGSNPSLTRRRGYKHKRRSKRPTQNTSRNEYKIENISILAPKDMDIPESIQNLTLKDLYALFPEGIPLKLFYLNRNQIETITQKQKEMNGSKPL